MQFVHRTWIDIDLDTLKKNYLTACSLTEVVVTCVLKANAYGHGAVRVAQALYEAGCRSFAVSCAREAFQLRRAGIDCEVLVMGLTDEGDLAESIRLGIVMTVADPTGIHATEAAAAALGMEAHVQLKLDTGFHRLGFPCERGAAFALARQLADCPHVRVDGLYSHLGLVNRELDERQHEQLIRMSAMLKEAGLTVPDVHICDSIGLVRYPQWHYTRVRVGAFLFGVRPSRSDHMAFRCDETLALRTTVAQLHQVEKGGIVGYGDDMPLERDSVIATLCAGYGDGYPRSLSNGRGHVLIRGSLCPVVGLICMDQMMVDVTDVPECRPGDPVTLLGDGISYMQFSDWAHTNRNECLTILSQRPLRVYHEEGRTVTVLDSMLNERRDL